MKIAFVSVRGIPNNYGGFEQFAEYISVGLVARGHDVTVYSPLYHPYKEDSYKGVKIKHIYSPEPWIGGSIGSIFYDFLSLRDALKKEDFDIIYEAGYTSIIPSYIWFNVKSIKYPIFTTNMDGLENKRSKFNAPTRKFLDWEEKMAVKHSHFLVADNMGIHDYYKEKYGKESKFLAYGANIHDDYNEEFLKEFGLKKYGYYLIVARMEPENNVEMAIQGYLEHIKTITNTDVKPLVIVGKMGTKHGKYLMDKYGSNPNLKFPGGIYDFDKLNSVRYFSYAYFHGHSVGGTNPSLLEAMASCCFILAHGNIFNRAVLKENALYYNNSAEVTDLLNDIEGHIAKKRDAFIEGELNDIRENYSWEHLVDQHEEYFYWLLDQKKVKCLEAKNAIKNIESDVYELAGQKLSLYEIGFSLNGYQMHQVIKRANAALPGNTIIGIHFYEYTGKMEHLKMLVRYADKTNKTFRDLSDSEFDTISRIICDVFAERNLGNFFQRWRYKKEG